MVRALASHARSHRFKSYTAHEIPHFDTPNNKKHHSFADRSSPTGETSGLQLSQFFSMLMMDADLKHRLEMMNLTNQQLFDQYAVELRLKNRNKRNQASELSLLRKFLDSLGDEPVSPAGAKRFLVTFSVLSPATVLRYASTIKGFMQFCGQPLGDLKLAHPHHLPKRVEDEDYEKLLAALAIRRSRRELIPRDLLLVKLARFSGLRRAELAELEIRDVHADFIMVREGKGLKDRAQPLPPKIAAELNLFCSGRPALDKVFDLSAGEISNKFAQWAKKAGVKLSAHSMRHKYAQSLLDTNSDIREVQDLLGHSDLNTTQVYLATSDKGLREAVNRLEKPTPANRTAQAYDLKATAMFEIKPAPYSPSGSPIMVGFCALEVQGTDLILESLQASTSETKASYQLLLLAEDPDDHPYDFEEVDLIKMKANTKLLHIQPLNGLRLRLPKPEVKKIYVGVGVSPRPISLADEDYDRKLGTPKPAYFEAPVLFNFTLRYQVE